MNIYFETTYQELKPALIPELTDAVGEILRLPIRN